MLGRGKFGRALAYLPRPFSHMVATFALCNVLLAAGIATAEAPIRIVAFGDSLTAGFGLKPAEAFPVQLEAALKAKGYNVEVINAGVSGDTTTAGLERFDWAVPDGADAAIVELGANDAMRGIDPGVARASLTAIVDKLKARNIEVLLAGMRAPTNWGADYARAFDAIFPDLAQANGLVLYPFFLDGVALDKTLNLDDGLHPTGQGVGVIVDRILPKVEELIGRVTARRAAKT